ncbi:hypothetical protein O9G_000793 [Rozella allomycis CSF55]|uniref:NAD(P)-binding domain-containing protein n=1 Tax=Rozella allomycis (strain CSF55) TaxID=988480 RepID=A0A075AR56_ROZAC|nr:hypothetical protein O9G_000793 [Rozella allomycis CSF55]|eukprot:EPZ32718.1 hypothetical protein O9G_000793 [Rozella allomycis CSF55]
MDFPFYVAVLGNSGSFIPEHPVIAIVTGGSGGIGMAVIKLLKKDHNITRIINLDKVEVKYEEEADSRTEWINVDFAGPSFNKIVSKLLNKINPSAYVIVIHCAGMLNIAKTNTIFDGRHAEE